jgi:hypothetical protein
MALGHFMVLGHGVGWVLRGYLGCPGRQALTRNVVDKDLSVFPGHLLAGKWSISI